MNTMTLCSGICKDGGACRFKAKTGYTTCGKHAAQGRAVVVVLCGHRLANGNLCQNARGEGLTLCGRHAQIVRIRAENRAAKIVWVDVMETLWTHRNVEQARINLADAFTLGALPERHFVLYAQVLEEEIAFFDVLHPPAAVVPVGELHALALDNQSVHTAPVNKQTQECLDLLLATPVADTEASAVVEIASLWGEKHPKSLVAVVKDMRSWYKTKTCRTKDDYLYKRALDGLWSRIKLSPVKDELLQRLWEECHESLKMCCEGHISRLCNVMCGFDDAFKAPVSVGEMLQQRMSAIAELEVSVHHKVGEAWAVFEELAIPMGERMAWLEAF